MRASCSLSSRSRSIRNRSTTPGLEFEGAPALSRHPSHVVQSDELDHTSQARLIRVSSFRFGRNVYGFAWRGECLELLL